MSKTFAEFARILSGSNNRLYDRYINFRLSREEPFFIGAHIATLSADDFEIRTPKTGIKPDITVSGTIILGNIVQQINLTAVNMSATIDTMAYNYLTVEAGYMDSGISTTFSGQITNCYMAKPNPNGELVVGATTAKVSALYAQGEFSVSFTEDVVDTRKLITTCLTAVVAAKPSLASAIDVPYLAASIPLPWATQLFTVGKSTRYFNNAFACITWLNSLFMSYVRSTGYGRGAGGIIPLVNSRSELSPLRLSFNTKGQLGYSASFSATTPDGTKTLSCIGSAVLTSTDSATVTAPFNPDINPGDVVFIDTTYFKTRLNIQSIRQDYAQMGNLWYVLDNTFTFSTRTANTMTLRLVNLNTKIRAQEG